ncbi:heterokaryon incompatibility protein-domain-containing protein, partial [Immersiella caudata]
QVRILAIYPGRPSSPIRGRLDIVSLAEEPVYQAVSYVWGSGELTHWVTLEQNGEETALDITANAHKLLTKIRSPWEERVIWIDGICINQTDQVEKTDQVKMMGEIYRGAWRVTAYLGS